MNLFEYISDRWDRLALQGLLHVSAVVQCTILAAVLGVVIGVAVYRSPIGSAVATALASTILTVPSFALLGLLIPVFGLGANTTVIALVLYALLPIVRNTIVGLSGVDPAVSDAARGIGMSRFGVLTRVELRLAWPAILAGMRVATQMLMGIAVIAAYAKGPGLGSEVFSGLTNAGSTNSLNQALTGTLGVVVLALVLDAVYVLINRLTVSRGVRG
ncbi:ABC transporter permease [Amycolatopsis sp. MJM2582]|uniref:Osmoprotectant transport system permease protein n=5 Tax=Amycolatopsis TaxID=1813 RepID=R4SV99_9PSEU|nr:MULTISPECIES: ABC transporter permease [Amycolatopsis]AGM02677.1 osmoprotectant transport system permease protein [Amycolatopsis keratiniphila]AIG73033.1 Conserved putative membrane protein [Amycolatopsis japonica]EME59920.1 proline/glycine/betaine ABC transporter permease [Amycolatopsis decaplanina DSM 44594]KFU80968.1 ABC transporter permease [Amycolatopsis lurida NRRL 2430]KFZ83422.1 ABC transporter permease [Amycolatopsis sp. MJM2582]